MLFASQEINIAKLLQNYDVVGHIKEFNLYNSRFQN